MVRSVVRKLYGRVLIKTEFDGTERAMGEGTLCFPVNEVCGKNLSKHKEIFWAFVDLELAYDQSEE